MDTTQDFRDFVVHAHPRLLRAAYLLTGNQHDAEDLAQTALVKAGLAWRRIQRVDNPDAYVRRVLVNTHISRWRTRSRRGEKLTADPPSRPVVDVELGRCEDRDQLRAALASLSPRQRAAVVLRYHEDLSVEETASLLDCTQGTVKTLTSRALAKLRTHLEPQCATT
ncbi:MAG: SigE family RNA polymerase sigma factor [Micromonosporaceae bacterium]